MKHYVSKSAQCPYYRKEDGLKVFCEGVEDGTAIQLSFDSGRHRRDYKDAFCCNGKWRDCRVAQMLGKKYEDG